MPESSWLHYVGHTTEGMTKMAIARRMGVDKSTVGRWDAHAPGVDSMKKFANAFSRPLVEVLLAAGVLTPADLEPYPGWNLDALTDEELLNILLRRARVAAGNRVRSAIESSGDDV